MMENLEFKNAISAYFAEAGITKRGKGYSFLYDIILLSVAYPNVNSKLINKVFCEHLNLPIYTLNYHVSNSLREVNDKRFAEGKEKLTKGTLVNEAINALWGYRKEILNYIELTYPENVVERLSNPEQRKKDKLVEV